MPPEPLSLSHRVCVAWLTRVRCATLCLLVHGCTNVNGGAVELSWKLRPRSGSSAGFIDCRNGIPVDLIELDWDVNGVTDARQWNCSDGHGVTAFDVPPGAALLTVKPVCLGKPADPSTYSAPAPERRNVIVGNTISLGAVEVVLQVSSCDMQPCVCQ
ncbi:MAG: hypothetical protein JWO36_2920 [Myxococcales bacterium]|nr:hypothetical protein [Myxococcales bacterium]